MRPSVAAFAGRSGVAIASLLLGLLAACAGTPQAQAERPTSPPETTPSTIADHGASTPILPTASPLEQILAQAEDAVRRPPQAREAITMQGLMFTDRAYAESREARKDWYAMLALALAARHSGQSRFRNALSDYLDAWLAVYRPSMDPINEADFHYFVFAVELARNQLTPAQNQAADALFRRMADGYSDRSRWPPGTDTNNWQSHRIKIVTAIAYALGDVALQQRCRQAYNRQLAANLRADGSGVDFDQRDALHYVVYSLEPLLLASLIAHEHGEDWYGWVSPAGSSLGRSLKWLEPYARGEQQHEEFRKTTVELDRRRAAAGLSAYSGLWNPTDAGVSYQLAAHLDPQWRPLAAQLMAPLAWIELRFPE